MEFKQLRKQYDSDEEVYFVWWLEEMVKNGFINQWSRAREFELSKPVKREYKKKLKTKVKKELEHVFSGSNYTPDFEIEWNKSAVGKFVTNWESDFKKKTRFYCNGNLISVVEIKGSFDNRNMTRLVNQNIKWMFQLYNIPVQLVKVPNIFKETFTPERYLKTNLSNRERKINFEIKSIKKYK